MSGLSKSMAIFEAELKVFCTEMAMSLWGQAVEEGLQLRSDMFRCQADKEGTCDG